jgi:hypothetical protein
MDKSRLLTVFISIKYIIIDISAVVKHIKIYYCQHMLYIYLNA